MGKQIIILACIGTFNPDLIRAKLAPVLAEAGLQIEGATTVYDGQHYLAIGRPDDINAALDVLNVSRVLAPEKKDGGPPSSAAVTGKAKAAKAAKKEDGPPPAEPPPATPGQEGDSAAEPPPPPESETQPEPPQ